ncbi:hypothetical protein AVEN_172337-1 [Araneus ventricosus]|uniref:Uncharacterized protein n=1 Tax=Araneus ventricosus TaxID=182803 RepID=A0A4Y2E1Z5_ARAVE|nr:hypothetical protein AVEN_172337-1 [Araneus ventricosus]
MFVRFTMKTDITERNKALAKRTKSRVRMSGVIMSQSSNCDSKGYKKRVEEFQGGRNGGFQTSAARPKMSMKEVETSGNYFLVQTEQTSDLSAIQNARQNQFLPI